MQKCRYRRARRRDQRGAAGLLHVRLRGRQKPGAYHYDWVSGPRHGYGFTSRRSDHERSTVEEHEAHIRDFLGSVDPVTGYLEDDPVDEDDEDPEVDPGPGHWRTIDRAGNVIRFPDLGAPE